MKRDGLLLLSSMNESGAAHSREGGGKINIQGASALFHPEVGRLARWEHQFQKDWLVFFIKVSQAG